MSLVLGPVTFREACAFITAHHRHHKAPRGMKFCIGVFQASALVGVATVSRPVARAFDPRTVAEVGRTCTDGARNANSMLYGASWRAAAAMGYRRLVTYTEAGESGASLRAAGWVSTAILPARSNWLGATRDPRLRAMRDTDGRGDVDRMRWEIGPDAAPALPRSPIDTCHHSVHTLPRSQEPPMPRKAAAPTAVSPAAANAALIEQLRIALEPVDETIGEKYDRLTVLLDTAMKTPGMAFESVSEVARAIPRPSELAAGYVAAAVEASRTEKERKRLSAAMLRYFDSPIGIEAGEEFEVEDTEFILVREFGQTPDRLDAKLLLEAGVSPEQIDAGTMPGTPYFKVAVRKVKVAKG